MSILITSTAGSFSAAVFYTLSSFFINRKKSEKTLKVTSTKRRIITIKHRWGLRGMLLIAPFISIPLAAIITAKFFRHIPHALTKLITAIILWSVLLSTLSCGIKFLTQKIWANTNISSSIWMALCGTYTRIPASHLEKYFSTYSPEVRRFCFRLFMWITEDGTNDYGRPTEKTKSAKMNFALHVLKEPCHLPSSRFMRNWWS